MKNTNFCDFFQVSILRGWGWGRGIFGSSIICEFFINFFFEAGGGIEVILFVSLGHIFISNYWSFFEGGGEERRKAKWNYCDFIFWLFLSLFHHFAQIWIFFSSNFHHFSFWRGGVGKESKWRRSNFLIFSEIFHILWTLLGNFQLL